MAANYFLGAYWTRARLEEMRTSLQTARITGNIIRVRTGPSQETEFDPKRVDVTLMLDQVQYAISQLPDADADNPADGDPYRQRPGITQPRFT